MNNTSTNNRTGLWISESKSGIKYMRGNIKIGDKEYLIKIFKNEKKEKSSQPDYNMLYDLKEEKNETKLENKPVELTDNDIDKLLNTAKEDDEQLELPF